MAGKGFIAGAITLAIALAAGGAQAHKPSHIEVLESLCSDHPCPDGPEVEGSMAMDANGNLFGFTAGGGTYGSGTAFELYREPGKTKWKYQTIYSFCDGCGSGSGPEAQTPVIDTAGNVYGAMLDGGAKGYGAFFELTPPGKGKLWNLTVLYSFCTKDNACHDGGEPAGSLTYQGASSGALYDGVSTLYGMNRFGGAHDAGVMFSLTRRFSHWREHVLYPFCSQGGSSCSDGSPDFAGLDSSGNLIGTGRRPYPDLGFVFRLSPNPGGRFWTETILYNFCSQANCADGARPSSGVIEDALGNLYGLTSEGGNTNCGESTGCGVLYKIATGNSETVLHTFCSHKDCADGFEPIGNLLMDTSGALYGVALGGGNPGIVPSFGAGIAFKLQGSDFHTLWAFCHVSSCLDGSNPVTGLTADPSGNLYGITEEGGANRDGIIFRLNQ